VAATSPTAAEEVTHATNAGTAGDDFATAIREVAQAVKPAVVQITNLQVKLDQFNQPTDVPAGVGSGVVYDDEGHILTNNHVIEGAQQLQVTFPDGRTFQGTLIGADSQTDLAVVQIEGDDLPTAPLGDSDALQVGDWVIAIGNALGLPGGPTVTTGVVSALGRAAQEPGDQTGAGPWLFNLIQTDAAINPGNSGGPLVNLAGEVIGINTLGVAQAEGIGFALSINTLKPLADELVNTGKVSHAYLGIRATPLTPAIAAQLGAQADAGAVVVGVAPGSPAAEAGLQPGDVITAIDGDSIEAESDLPAALSSHKPGDEVTLTVERGGKQLEVNVTLGEAPRR
jgi:S1-C subfamily serine protease